MSKEAQLTTGEAWQLRGLAGQLNWILQHKNSKAQRLICCHVGDFFWGSTND